ncbi:MAG: DNA alkylation repair protein, partial [Euryarchaeota archaeon]|nr:DNA alkylation repair protein [Euryarchaeota archaeon]
IWNESSFEVRQIAGKCLEKFGPKNPEICLDFVSSVLPDLDNWAVCDNLAMFGVEPIVYSNPELVLPLSEKWINLTMSHFKFTLPRRTLSSQREYVT